MATDGSRPWWDRFGRWGRLIAGLFGGRTGTVPIAVKFALVDLQQGLLDLGEIVGESVARHQTVFASLFGLLRRFYRGVLAPLLVWLRAKWRALEAWLRRTFKPLFEFLLRIRREVLQIYTKFIRPVLDVIQAVRFALQTLGRLGVEWARELDRKLAAIEHAITRSYLTLLGTINQIIDVVDAVVTFDLLFQRVPFLRTLQRDIGLWTRLFWRAQVAGMTPEEAAAARARKYLSTDPVENGRTLGEFYLSQGGPLAPVIMELVPVWMIAAGLKSAKPQP